MIKDTQSLVNPRPEIVGLVPDEARKVLDIGCGNGNVALALKDKVRREVTGIEFDRKKAAEAALKLDNVIVGDIETLELKFDRGYFDCIIFGDVLEHLRNPLETLKRVLGHLGDNGRVIISIPNIRHVKILFDLAIRGEWRYESFGILDEGHLRFFTYKSLMEFIKDAGLEVIHMDNIFSLKGSRIFNTMTFGLFKELLTAQFVILARRK